MCGDVVLQALDDEVAVAERFFDGRLPTVCRIVVSGLSPVSGQTLVEQGFGGAEGTPSGSVSSVMNRSATGALSRAAESDVGQGSTSRTVPRDRS